MFLLISFLAALAGVALACAAALLGDTGVDGTLGAFLALFGTVAASVTLGLLITGKAPERVRGVLLGLAGLATLLTALAAFFLMQDVLLIAMAVSFMALLVSAATTRRKATL